MYVYMYVWLAILFEGSYMREKFEFIKCSIAAKIQQFESKPEKFRTVTDTCRQTEEVVCILKR